VYRGPDRNLDEERLSLTYLGQVGREYTSQDIRANRFQLTLRDISEARTGPMFEAIQEVGQVGVPNYFDDQRFGSVGGSGQFIAHKMIRGEFEEALKLALVEPYEFDRAMEKREKQILTEHWRDWPACKEKLPRGHARSITDYLVHHPTDFKGAVARLKPELLSIYLSAYQSHVWNRLLRGWLRREFAEEQLASLPLQLGKFPTPRTVTEEKKSRWVNLSLPLPSARLKPDSTADWLPILDAVLAEDELTLAKMKITKIDKPYFSKGDRPACLFPERFVAEEQPDELHTGKRKVLLKFELPRGAYATMIVKRIMQLE
jgi:tRNA pseudouridine13 synthase